MPEYLSVAQVADRLGIQSRQVLNLIKSGRLQAFRVGASRAWIISEDALAQVERRPTGRPRKVSEQ